MRCVLVPKRVVVNGDVVAATASPLAREITGAGVRFGRVDTRHRVVKHADGRVQLHNRSTCHLLYVRRADGGEEPVAMNGGTTTMNNRDSVWLVRSLAAVVSRRRVESWVRMKVHCACLTTPPTSPQAEQPLCRIRRDVGCVRGVWGHAQRKVELEGDVFLNHGFVVVCLPDPPVLQPDPPAAAAAVAAVESQPSQAESEATPPIFDITAFKKPPSASPLQTSASPPSATPSPSPPPPPLPSSPSTASPPSLAQMPKVHAKPPKPPPQLAKPSQPSPKPLPTPTSAPVAKAAPPPAQKLFHSMCLFNLNNIGNDIRVVRSPRLPRCVYANARGVCAAELS
jgi:hypothetical protein